METLRTNYTATAAARPEVAPNPPSRPATDNQAVAVQAQTGAGIPGRPAAQASVKASQEDRREQLQALLNQVGDRLQPESRALSFRINEDIDGVVVSVIDTQTDELIRQIPAETMVRLAKTLEQLDASTANAGLLLNEKA